MKTKGRRALTAGLAVVIAGGSLNVPYYAVQAENTYAAKPYIKNIDEQISAYTSKYTDFKALTKVNNGNYTDTEKTSSVKLWTKDVETDESFAVRSVKIYADKDSFTRVTMNVGIDENTNTAFTKAAEFNNLEWKSDDKGSYVEVSTDYNFLGYGYELVFDKEVDVKEVDVTGVYFKENLFDGATITYNDEKLSEKVARGMLDNAIRTDVQFAKGNGQGKQEVIISSNDGTEYAVDTLFLSSNFMAQQGTKGVKVSYWENGQWKEAESSVLNSVDSAQDQRRQMLAIDLPKTVVSSKIKLDLEFNTNWNHGVITEVNAIGTKVPSAAAVAELVKIDPLTAGNKRLTFSNLDKIVKNWEQFFEVSVATTSNPEAVRADGTVNHTEKDQTSKVTLTVKNKNSGKTATTGAFDVSVPRALEGDRTQADLQIDYTTAYKNPAMGWVAYVEGFECAVHDGFDYKNGKITNNWNARNKGLCVEIGNDAASAQKWIDQMNSLIKQGMPCNIVYIREPWSWFEPKEDQYAWEDENSACYAIVNWARENNIQLAFRIITCSSACAQQATPQWVFDDGAKGKTSYKHDYVKNVNDPYLDDAVFQKHFKDFTAALGKRFNNEGTAFIDAHGHGQWGEMNGMTDVLDASKRKQTIQYLEDCFVEAFPDVLLGGQQGSSGGGGAIEESFNTDGKNFVVRRDAFGSDIYLRNSGNAAKIKEYRKNGIPVFAENCYHHFDSRNFRWSKNIAYSSGRINEYSGDNPFTSMKDMMDKVIFDALDLGANTIDLRTLEDAKLWMQDGQEFLDEFTQEGGYRISVDDAIFTNKVKQGEELTVESSWVNNGSGIVPNNNKRWGEKMKVAFALIDESGKIAQTEIVSTDKINVGDFEKNSESDYKYETTFKVNEDLSGTYKLAVAVVNAKDDNNVGIQLANKDEKTNGGYVTLGTVNVSEDGVVENAAPTLNATDKTITVGDVFDVMAGVTASDEEDGDLTDKIEVVKNEVDTKTPGTYEVTYKVTDSQGASTTKTITVTVKQGTEVENAAPTIHAKDQKVKVGDVFDPLKNVTAKDKEDGNLTDKIEVVKNEVDTSTPGTYEVTYKVTDSQGASATKTITVTVVEKGTDKPTKPEKPNKPNKPNKPGAPETSDTGKVGLLSYLFAASGAVAGAVLFGRRRRKDTED